MDMRGYITLRLHHEYVSDAIKATIVDVIPEDTIYFIGNFVQTIYRIENQTFYETLLSNNDAVHKQHLANVNIITEFLWRRLKLQFASKRTLIADAYTPSDGL